MKLTPSQVKNLMRRGLRLIVDPEPEKEEKQRCISFFEHRCAYCGEAVEKGHGDLDHLVSAALGGRNHISNRVFSCKRCNAEEKREKNWESFLVEKYGTSKILTARRQKILEWVSAAGAIPSLSNSLLLVIDEHSGKATAFYDEACKRVRDAQRDISVDVSVGTATRQKRS